MNDSDAAALAPAPAQATEPRQDGVNEELPQVEPGPLRDADQMKSSSHQPSSDAGVKTPYSGQAPLGFPPNEPLGDIEGVGIPTPGFTSALYYDPYVEIKDFLDALKSGANFRVGAGEHDDRSVSTTANSKSTRQLEGLNSSESQSPGVFLNDDPQVPTSLPDAAAPEASEAAPALISAESDTSRSAEAENANPDSKVGRQSPAAPAEPTYSPNKEKAIAAASETNEDAINREVHSSIEAEIVESPPEYTTSNGPETAPMGNLGERGETNEVPQDTESPQQRIQSAKAMQPPLPPTVAPAKSSHSQTLGFAASLTASFAPETKSAWAQLFGSKYEDEIDPKAAATRPSFSSHEDRRHSKETDNLSESRASLKAKLERERKLDQQIQASQQKFKERSLRKEFIVNHHNQQHQSPKRQGGSSSTAPIPFKPFEMAGLSITRVRFCVEKALQATCKCFQQLYALALNEPRIPKAEAEHGMFVSQWELERLLQELFGPPREQDGTKTTSLYCFALADPQYTGVPLELLLQATWFLPFDQLTRLRSLVLQITRKHLNEHKLAVLNRHLQKQLLLVPYSTRLQQVLLQFSGHRPYCHTHEPNKRNESDGDGGDEEENSVVSTAPPLVHCTASLVQNLLECIAVPVPAELVPALGGDKDFLLLSPFELVQKWRLSSLLCIQRVIFFRFLVDAITMEQISATTTSSSSGCKDGNLQTAHRRELSRSGSQCVHSVQSRTKASATAVAETRFKQETKNKKKPKKSAKPSRSTSSISGESESERSEKLRISRVSVVATQRSTTSLLSNNNNDDHIDRLDGSGTGAKQQQQQLHTLQHKLLASLSRLEEIMPWLLKGDESGSPAIKATYLAASAFHQSLDIMIKSRLALDCDVMDKLQHFIEAIDALTIAAAANAAPSYDSQASASRSKPSLPHPAVAAATTIVTASAGGGSSRRLEEFPPPFPDLTREQEKARFPPPYEASGTSYWAFKPELPQTPAASVAKPSAIHPALYPAHPSPGVSAYDIQRSDRVTLQQKAGYSFRKAGIGGGGRDGDDTPTPSKDSSSTPNKPRIYKGSAFARQSSSSSPAVVRPSDNNLESSEPSRHSVGVGAESRSMQSEPLDDRNGNDDDDECLEVDILNALRRQHNMVVNDFMQDILLQHHHEHQSPHPPPSYNSPGSSSPVNAKVTTHSRKATTTATQEPKWRSSSSESRFVNRLRGREPTVDAPSFQSVDLFCGHKQQDQHRKSSSMRPQSVREAAKPVPTKPTSTVKPRYNTKQQSHLSKPIMKTPLVNCHEQPNDEHLAWAARISDFYKATRGLDDQIDGA